MNKDIDYISESKIVSYLCRDRAKIAKQRNKKHLIHLLTKNKKYNYHVRKLNDTEKQLQQLLPSRRKWKKLGKKPRYRNGQKLNSVDNNYKALQKTIDYYKKTNPSEPFLKNLNKFIIEVQKSVKDESFSFSKPEIYPKLKNDKRSNNNYRPISLFSLKDKLIISLINKYFTDIFDEYFPDCSFAFRAPQKINGERKILFHHDTIRKILDYQKKFKGQQLWIAECDMEKFYDTVNHTIIKKSFRRLIHKVKRNKPECYDSNAERIFYKYLDCYKFNKDVFPEKKSSEIFKNFNIKKGKFGWPIKDLKKFYYKSFNNAKIGVPQGGALSGLIANIVLDCTDRKILKNKDKDLLYIRYCDDMIIMHPDKMKCKEALSLYKDALCKLKLIPHKFEGKLTNTSFWEAKSKKPYKWCGIEQGGFPWIGFVGYEIHYNGFIRARKKSLKKEMKKQYEVVNEVKLAIKNNNRRKSIKEIEESVIHRLIGMSVGRVEIWNYKTVKNDMCWVTGFSELNDNKYSRIQLKRLDKCRNKLIWKLKRELSKYNEDNYVPKEKDKRKKHSIAYYGKPFSYYYQVIERKKLKRDEVSATLSGVETRIFSQISLKSKENGHGS